MKRRLLTLGLVLLGIGVGYRLTFRSASRYALGSAASSDASAPAPAKGELWLSDFESPSELKRWKSKGVAAALSEEHAVHGGHAAKLTYSSARETAFKMEEYLANDAARSDWRPYRTLVFDIYNDSSKQEKFLVGLKDKAGKRYKEKLILKGKSAKRITVPLRDIASTIDLAHVVQVNLFRWAPKNEATVYLDGVRLISDDGIVGQSLAGVSRASAPSLTSEGDLWLSDFESEEELGERWELKGVSAERVREQAAHGQYAVKVTFEGGGAPVFKLEDFLQRDTQYSNWKPYAALQFTVANAQSSPEKLLIQLKDIEGKRVKQTLRLEANEVKHVTIPLAETGMSLGNVIQFNIFQWEPKSAAAFYLDAVRLTRDASGIPKRRPSGSARNAGTDGVPAAAATMATAPEPAFRLAKASPTPNQLGGLRFAAEVARWQVTDPSTGQPVVRVPIELVGPEMPLSAGFSVSGGIPFAMGQCSPEAAIRLTDASGLAWSAQTRTLARWEDGSVKWLLVTTQIPPRAAGRQVWLEYGKSVTAPVPPASRVVVEETPDSVTVTTGPLRFGISRQQFRLFESAAVDRNGNGLFEEAERLAGPGDLVVKHGNTEFRSSNETKDYTLTVEESGPLRATLKASGWLRDKSGKGFCQFIVRIQAFAGLPQVRLYHTFIYTGYPANKYHHEYKDVKLPENETIQDISLEFPVTTAAGADLITADEAGATTLTLSEPTTMSQLAGDAYQVRQGSRTVRTGQHTQGWMLVQNTQAGVMVGVRDAWQQFPKEWIVDPKTGRLVVKLWPASAGDLDLQTGPEAFGPDDVARGSAFGLGKTHELTVSFLGQPITPDVAASMAGLWQEPWLLSASPEWLVATDVWGQIGPRRAGASDAAEMMLDRLFAWAERQPRTYDWYGMLNYGDTLDWYRNRDDDKSYDGWGWHPVGRWGWFGCEFMGTHAGVLTSFLRTHELNYFRFADAMTRHIMDVDTVHYNTVANDPRLSSKIPDTFAKVGSMHRHSAYHWSGRNDEADHTNVTGILMYYYLTGYERAFDVAKEVGNFFLQDPVTYTQHPDMAPSRALGNLMWGDVLLYQATGDARYREAADRWAKVLIEGQRPDGTWLETYNPRDRVWGGRVKNNYIVFYILQSLMAYHRLTGDEVAAQAIVRGTEAMMAREQERQLFDALAYSYLLTGQRRFLDDGQRRLGEHIKAQRVGGDPLYDGMIYQKAIYERVAPVLYQVPYLLGAMDAPDFITLQSTFGNQQTAIQHPTSNIQNSGAVYEVQVVSSTTKVLPEVPSTMSGARKNPVSLSLARNEYESAQLVVTSPTTLERVRLEPGDLAQVGGSGVIPRSAVTWSLVGFVRTKQPGYAVSHVGLWPDPLPGPVPFIVNANQPQPMWLTVYASPATPPGDYAGMVTIRPGNALAHEVELRVHVWDFALPATPSLATAFDVYLNRLESGYRDFFPEWWASWQSRQEELAQRVYDDLLAHRLSPILNIELSDAANTESLRRLSRQGLSAFAVGRRGGSFENNWPKDPAALAQLEPVYRGYAQELRAAGLLDEAYVYTFDEPKPDSPRVPEVTKLMHRADPQLRNLVVLEDGVDADGMTTWLADADIVCLRNVTFDAGEAEKLTAQGKDVWLYVSGPEPPYPTLVIDYPAMAARILPWMCWKYGLKGLLYWCVNYWTTNPYQDPMNTTWQQNGNGLLYYPGPNGPVPSIRLELLRDGMEDYEYLSQLASLVRRAEAAGVAPSEVAQAKTLLAVDPQLVESMRTYAQDAGVLEKNRQAIASLIEQLQSVLEDQGAGGGGRGS